MDCLKDGLGYIYAFVWDICRENRGDTNSPHLLFPDTNNDFHSEEKRTKMQRMTRQIISLNKMKKRACKTGIYTREF